MAFYWVNIHYGPLDNVILMKNTWNPNSAKRDRPTTQQAGDTDFVIAAAATFKIEESKLIPASAVKADFKGKTEIVHKCQLRATIHLVNPPLQLSLLKFRSNYNGVICRSVSPMAKNLKKLDWAVLIFAKIHI